MVKPITLARAEVDGFGFAQPIRKTPARASLDWPEGYKPAAPGSRDARFLSSSIGTFRGIYGFIQLYDR